MGMQTMKVAKESKAKVIERKYGAYVVKICFAEQEDPDAAQNVLNVITQSFRRRLERAGSVAGEF